MWQWLPVSHRFHQRYLRLGCQRIGFSIYVGRCVVTILTICKREWKHTGDQYANESALPVHVTENGSINILGWRQNCRHFRDGISSAVYFKAKQNVFWSKCQMNFFVEVKLATHLFDQLSQLHWIADIHHSGIILSVVLQQRIYSHHDWFR